MSVSETGYHRELAAPPPGRLKFSPRDTAEILPFEPPLIDIGGHEAGASLVDYWQALVKHRLAIAMIVLIVLAIGLAVTLLMPAAYTATATIQIDREAPRVVTTEQVEPDEIVAGDEFYQTQYGLLRSKSLAQRVVQALGLATNPAFVKHGGLMSWLGLSHGAAAPVARAQGERRAFGVYTKHLKIEPVRGSHLVKINYTDANPVLAAQVANATADNFITSNLERRYEASSYARDFLAAHLADVKVKLEDSEKQLADYATREGIINLPGPNDGKGDDISQSPTANSLVTLNTALSEATADRIKAEQEWRAAAGSSGENLPQVLQNATIQAMVQSRAALQATYQDKLSLYKPNFPTMVQLRAQITELDKQIATATNNVKASLRSQYEVSASQERSLEGKVGQLKGSMLDLNNRSIQYNILQREVDTNRSLYDGLLQRYKEVGVAGGVGANNISVVDRADAPTTPSQPQPLLDMGLALLGGLVLGVLAAFGLEALDQSIRTPEDVEQKLALPLLGAVPLLQRGQAPRPMLDDVKSAFSEAYYSVRTSLQFSTNKGAPATLFVTSYQASEGKSTTALALAQNFARIGARVLLVDADMRDPSQHHSFDVDTSVGFSSFLAGATDFAAVVRPTGIPRLFITPCGPLPPSPAELLAGMSLRVFLQRAHDEFDVVVIDGPPVMGLADAPILSAATEGTVLVVESGKTRRGAARAALRRLQSGNGKVIGIVLTKFNARKATYGYGYDYAYGYGYGERGLLGGKT